MEKNQIGEREIIIDWLFILKSLLKRAWIIILAGAICGITALIYTLTCITPMYSSSVMLYVNNKSFSLGNTSVSISAADLSASQSLIDTYITILNNRTTMEEVAEESGLDYSYGKLQSMISTSKVEGTEVFRVTVTSDDPNEAAHIANCVSKVLPERIEDIIEGSSMRIVDKAVVNTTKVSPSVTSNTLKFFVIGAFITALAIALLSILDDTIRSEDYILQTYNVPILSKIPVLGEEVNVHKDSYYYKKNQYYYRGGYEK